MYVARIMINFDPLLEIGIVFDIVRKPIAVNYQKEKEIRICINRYVNQANWSEGVTFCVYVAIFMIFSH